MTNTEHACTCVYMQQQWHVRCQHTAYPLLWHRRGGCEDRGRANDIFGDGARREPPGTSCGATSMLGDVGPDTLTLSCGITQPYQPISQGHTRGAPSVRTHDAWALMMSKEASSCKVSNMMQDASVRTSCHACTYARKRHPASMDLASTTHSAPDQLDQHAH